MTSELICIVCPRGCRLNAAQEEDGSITVRGAGCERGQEYAVKELTAPERMVTSTVHIKGGAHPRLPVKTAAPIPKSKVMQAARALKDVMVHAPVHTGDVILENVAGTGVAVVATRDL